MSETKDEELRKAMCREYEKRGFKPEFLDEVRQMSLEQHRKANRLALQALLEQENYNQMMGYAPPEVPE